ncbi:MAG: phospholipase [Ferruginibacter sp.]|nr:phospholipase [Ferruginibacter sp.]
MKKLILFSYTLLAFLNSLKSQDIYDSVYFKNRWRTFMTHLPSGYSPDSKYPLVLCFHGGQNGATQSQLGWRAIAYMSKLNQKSDSAKFILVYPEGTVINNIRTWNAGACCPPAMNYNIDDVGFTNNMLDSLFEKYSIDTTRVYAAGSSNGAMLCFRLACELSNRIAAIATISATQAFFPCNPLRKMPIINIHSKVDDAVPYNGGVGVGPSGVNFISQDSTMKIWKYINQCVINDTIVNGRDTNYTHIRIHNGICNTEFHQFATSDGGHSWPGGNPNNNPVSYQINATDLLWSFFQHYRLDCGADYFFDGNGNWNDLSNWQDSMLPPANLTGKSRIFINPKNGQSILNSTQTINAGSELIIKTGRNLWVPGRIDIQ